MQGIIAQDGAVLAFDYSTLDKAVARTVQATASRLRTNLVATKTAMVDIGRDLLATKDALPHGQFGAWLAAEFDMSDRTARRYMEVAEAFGAETAIVSVLPPTALYALAAKSTPEEVRSAVAERVGAGERVSEAEIRRLSDTIRNERAQERQTALRATRRKKMTPEAAATDERRERARLRREEAEARASERRAEERKAALDHAVSLAIDAFGDNLGAFAAALKVTDPYSALGAALNKLVPISEAEAA